MLNPYKFFFLKLKLQAGQSLVEILLAMGLAVIILPALLTGLVSSRQGKAQQTQRTQAVYLLNETVDAVRSVREKGWAGFAVNGTYHPVISGSSWTLATGSATVNGFTQTVDIGDVQRATSGAIVTSDGSFLDPSSKKVDIAISWGQPYASTVSASLYITRYLDNNSFTQTTVADFNTGTKSGTIVTNTGGGEVTLGAGGQGDWCAPNLSIAALDLPKQGVADAITAIEGRAFVGTGDNASGVSFANVSISNANPPIATIAGTFDGYKTNGVYGETNYAYLATDTTSKEVVIIDLTQIISGKYQEAGFFNAPTNKKGDQVWVSGNVGYLITEQKLYSFDLSSKNGSRPILDPDGVTVGDGTRVVVVGNYAYVAIKESSIEVQIVDVNDPSNMVIVGQVDLTGKDAKDIVVNSTGTRAYVVTGKQDNQREFFIINTETKIGNQPVIGSYEASGMDPKALTVVPGNKAIIVGKDAEHYQVVDISNEAVPFRCGGLTLDSNDLKVNGISSVIEADGDAYSYIMTAALSSEFKIIEGGPGGQYASLGTFISGPFDAGYSAAFNRFDVSVNRSSISDIQFQVAVANEVLGSCNGATFNFVGPNASSSAFFTTTASSSAQSFSYPIPPIINPGRCFKYKAFLSTTDPLSTPIFYDMTGNYSP